MPAQWLYTHTLPTVPQGRGISEDNFAPELRTALEILIRETLQNPLDARPEGSVAPVCVALRKKTLNQEESAFLASLLDEDFQARLRASTEDPPSLQMEGASVLTIEDFGTTGLQGTFTDPDKDGSTENWNAFWFREGEGAKSGPGSNGRAGQGKITYYRTSEARAIFGLTIRAADAQSLVMGRASFRRAYRHNDGKFLPHAYWCVDDGGKALPERDAGVAEQFRTAFGLERITQPGLSLVIPFPVDFQADEAIRVVLSEFYFPIAAGRLEVSIQDTHVTAANISTLADEQLTPEYLQHRGSCYTKGYRLFVAEVVEDLRAGKVPPSLKAGWEKSATLLPQSLPDGLFEDFKKALQEGSRISLRCPLAVKSRKAGIQQTHFDIHLQVPEDLERTEEAYIRKDLLIGSEAHLGSASYLEKARGLTLISDPLMSAFMADAEEPTHLKWNASRPRLTEDYVAPKELVRAVRQALPRLLGLLSGQSAKRDVKALAKYFARPAAAGKTGGTGKTKPGPQIPPPPPLPEPKPRFLKLDAGKDWVRITTKSPAVMNAAKLPLTGHLELAYEGLDLDPFRAYDPFDFDLANESAHPVQLSGMTVVARKNNRIDFAVVAKDASMEVRGFDSNVRMRARLTYEEATSDAAIDNE